MRHYTKSEAGMKLTGTLEMAGQFSKQEFLRLVK